MHFVLLYMYCEMAFYRDHISSHAILILLFGMQGSNIFKLVHHGSLSLIDVAAPNYGRR
jgi:hypothetical protein